MAKKTDHYLLSIYTAWRRSVINNVAKNHELGYLQIKCTDSQEDREVYC